METHTFPPECLQQLKAFPSCTLSEAPEFLDMTTRCVVCRRSATRHHCLDLMGEEYDSDALWRGDCSSWLSSQGHQ
ncbi:adhesion regulating molecule, putative, partial [Eimeria tenella]